MPRSGRDTAPEDRRRTPSRLRCRPPRRRTCRSPHMDLPAGMSSPSDTLPSIPMRRSMHPRRSGRSSHHRAPPSTCPPAPSPPTGGCRCPRARSVRALHRPIPRYTRHSRTRSVPPRKSRGVRRARTARRLGNGTRPTRTRRAREGRRVPLRRAIARRAIVRQDTRAVNPSDDLRRVAYPPARAGPASFRPGFISKASPRSTRR
jgi:hypothetical protein